MSAAAGTSLLAGYRVLDLADETGAACGRILADLGAEVLKVEPPGGCASRRVPPFAGDDPGPETSLFHLCYNVGKRSLTLDLEAPSGQALFRQLARSADALVETLPPGSMARRGLGYPALAAVNPGLVYTALTPFGQDGPRSGWRGPEPVVFALSGAQFVSGEAESPPCAAPGYLAYGVACSFAAMATLVALYARAATGRGQFVDVSALECAALITDSAIPKYSAEGQIGMREGDAYRFITPGGLYPCRDGYVRIVAGQPAAWKALVEWIEDPELARPEWANREQRNRHRAFVDGRVAAFTSRYTRAELFERGQARRVPVSPLNTPAEFVDSALAAERGYVAGVEHPLLGQFRAPGAPFRLDGSPTPPRSPAPLLGQHNAEVYVGELGLSADELAALAAARVV